MPTTVCGFRVDPSGQTMVVDVTNAGGNRETAYTARHGSTAHSFPVTITTATDFFFAKPFVASVSVKQYGREIAGRSGNVLSLDLTPGTHQMVTPGIDLPAEITALVPDSSSAASGAVLTADGAGGTAWESASKVSLIVDPLTANGTSVFSTITAAMAAAATAGGASALIKRGTYSAGETFPIQIPANTDVMGEGESTLVYLPNGSATGTPSPLDVIHVAGSNSSVRNLRVNGNRLNQTGNSNCIRVLSNLSRVRIVDNHVLNANGYGIVAYDGCTSIEFSRNIVEGCRDEALEFLAVSQGIIADNLVVNTGKIGIYVWGPGTPSSDVTIIGNQVNGWSNLSANYAGIRVDDGMGSVTVSGNSLSNGGTGGPGIVIGSSTTEFVTNCTVVGNVVRAPSGSGIVIGNYASAVVVAGNIVRSGGTHGIYVASANTFRVTVTGNQVNACAGDGIKFDAVGGQWTCTGNMCYSNANGINVVSSTTGTITGNSCNTNAGKGILSSGSSNTLSIVGNNCAANSDGTADVSFVGSSNNVANNIGRVLNVGPLAAPAVPASGVAQTNTFSVDAMVHVAGGTVSAIAVGGTGTGMTSGSFKVLAGQTITLTYSVAPTWTWFGG